MTNCPKHPAVTAREAIDLLVDNVNRISDVLNGDTTTTVETCEGNGSIPSVQKALSDAAAYKVPLNWSASATETDLLQPRIFDNAVYVPLTVPVLMDTTPDSNWRLYSLVRDRFSETYSTLAAVKAIPHTSLVDGQVIHMSERTAGNGGGGTFIVVDGDNSAAVTADEVTSGQGDGGIWVSLDSNIDGSVRALKRLGVSGAVDTTWYGVTLDGTGDNAPILNAAREYFVTKGTGGFVDIPPGTCQIASTVELKKGIVFRGAGYPNADTTNEGTVIILADGSDTTMFKSAAVEIPFLGMSNMLIDGNKANQSAGSFHGIEVLGLDVSNQFHTLKIQNCRGAGFYINNTGPNEQGSSLLREVVATRCDGGGIVAEGATQALMMLSCTGEGNGLTTTGNIVLNNLGRFSTTTLVGCRTECRTQAQGGGISGVEVIDANEGNIEIFGGFYQFANDCQALVRLTHPAAAAAEARVRITGYQLTNTVSDVVIIKDIDSGREVKESDLNGRATEILWEKYPAFRSASNNNTFFEKINANDDISSFMGGNPNPNGSITAPKGSLYERISAGDFSEAYYKVDGAGNTGWLAILGKNFESFADGDTTPSVQSGEGVYSFSGYTAPATVTNLDNPTKGQLVELYNPSANAITVQHGASIKLSGSVDFVMSQFSSLTLRYSGAVWYEVSRSAV